MNPTDTESMTLLRTLVECDSSNPGVGEAAVAELVAEEGRVRGFGVQMIEPAPGRVNIILDIDAGPGPVLAFNGHLDTKAIGDARPRWNTDPHVLTVDGDRAYGVGTSDMKAGVAAMIVAGSRWAETATAGRVQLVLVADEEAGGVHGAVALCEQGAVDAEAMLIAEPCGMETSWEALYAVSRGIACFDVEVRGRQAHSGLSDRHGTSATVAAARMIDALSRMEPTRPPANGRVDMRPTVNAGVRVEGGVFYGVHPGLASFASDIRLLPGMTKEGVEADIRAALDSVEAASEDISYSLEFAEGARGWCPGVEIDPGHRLVACAQEALTETLGHSLPLAAYPGATDASHWGTIGGLPCIAALGPGLLSLAHGANEYVPIADLAIAEDLFTRIMGAYCAGGAAGA